MSTDVVPEVAKVVNDRGKSAIPARSSPRRTWPHRLAAYVVFIGTWQLASGTLVDSFKLPSPWRLVVNMGEIAQSGELWFHSSATLQRVAVSMVFIFVLGGAIGGLMGFSTWWEQALRDIVSLLISIPGLVFVLIFLIVFGLSSYGAIAAIVVTNFAFVTVQVWEGVRSIPKDLMAMSRSYGVSRARIVRHVLIPALAPFLFTAMTYSFALTWKLTMLTELFGSSRGVGFKMRVEFAQFSVDGMLTWALAFYIFALVMERLVFQKLSKRFFRWREV